MVKNVFKYDYCFCSVINSGKKGAKGAYKLADPLPSGEILNDLSKGSWVTGKAVGCGGFGLIYLGKHFL